MTVRLLRSLALSCTALPLVACVSAVSPTAIVGQPVADRLNALYANTVDDCSGQSAYRCSGVVVRVLDRSVQDLQPLDPSPTQIARDGVSFTFLRKDLNIATLYEVGWAGYTLDMRNDTGFVPMRARCMFVANGGTSSRPDACGYAKGDMTPTLKSRPCAPQGVLTPEAWGAHFASLPNKNYSCGFATSAQEFRLSMASRAFIPEDSLFRRLWNELVIGAWTQEEVRRLPVEAVFYKPNESIPLRRVQRVQCQIYFATGRPVPLLKLDLAAADGVVFSFDPAEQIDFDSATPTCEYAAIPLAAH